MAGSDLPSAGSGGIGGVSPPPTTPKPASRKRRRGGGDHDDDGDGPPSRPSRGTRSSAAAREIAVGPLRTVRRAATGALWAGRDRGRGLGDLERTQAAFLAVRRARYAPVPDEDDDEVDYPYRKECWYLKSSPSRKRVGTDPVQHLASVPEWKGAPSEDDTDDYKAATLPKLGTVVCPLNMDISATGKPDKARKRLVDKCKCSHPGSEDCVRVHVIKARSWIKDQLGEEDFKNCGLDAMGDQVEELWTRTFKRKLVKVEKLIPQDKHKDFMEIALKELGQKKTKDLAKHYFNVFLPRRLASWTRAKHKKDEAVDTNDEKSDQEGYKNEQRPRKKSKSSGSSSTRCRK